MRRFDNSQKELLLRCSVSVSVTSVVMERRYSVTSTTTVNINTSTKDSTRVTSEETTQRFRFFFESKSKTGEGSLQSTRQVVVAFTKAFGPFVIEFRKRKKRNRSFMCFVCETH
jgi:hypothetical protein